MEIEEETTSNHLNKSMTEETTTLINENSTSTDKESEKNLTELISESKQDKPEGVSPAADHCTNSEPVTSSSGAIENAAVSESKEIDVPSDDVVAVECELTSFVNADGGQGEDKNVCDFEVIKKKDENDGDSVNVQLKDVENVQEIVENVQEIVEKVQEIVENVKNENVDNVNIEGGEIMKQEQVVKEDRMVFDEEKNVDVKEETLTEISDHKETTVEDEEKSLDDEIENETLLDTEGENEKSLDSEMETETEIEKSLDDEMETKTEIEKSLDNEMETQAEIEKSLDTEMETDDEKIQEELETELPELSTKGKRKRGGKALKATPKSSPAPKKKTIEEDVCFICFDGGDLVLCDRKNCPKAYHASCVNRDESFFQSKGRWNCGWHLCSICEKKAEYMCYTCTYSLCKACTKTSVILCVREKEKKGLCEACMKTVLLIEKQEDQENVNFDDKNSWEHLFKDYWTETKAKHNLSLAELNQAKNPWKGSRKQESPIAQSDVKDDDGSSPVNPHVNIKARKSKRITKKQKSAAKEDDSVGSVPENAEWVSKDLLEFVMHMRNGDSSVISQFEVQDLLLEYIKRNKLRDPNRKSYVICDARLENLFGKQRVAHIEMLKLIESHFLVKEDSQIDEIQGTVVDTEAGQADEKEKKRKGRKRGDKRGPQSNREDYAAIDIHNISLIYLRRKLVEDLLDDMESFHEKIFGTFVRIRISGANPKQDIYRLVQVTGTSEAARYTLSKRTTNIMLEILNLDKSETISIDSISNQEFMEDECKRLRQSIKCGFIRRLTVGDVLDKAMELQLVRVNDWLETEVVRLNHLRDRASDLGRKKDLRECVEKLNLLKKPEERARRLEEIPSIHDDPTMDPNHVSEADTDSDDKKQELYKRSDSFRFNKRGRDQFSPRGDYTSKESWSGTPRSSSSSRSYEFTRNISNKIFSSKTEDPSSSLDMHIENSRDQGRDMFVQQPLILEKPVVPLPLKTPVAAEIAPKINETEKMWHYKDPSEKIQGPFSMVQLRKWSKNGYFPDGLKIWRKSDKEDDAILLSDALDGNFKFGEPRTVGQDSQSLTRDRTHGSHLANLPSPTPMKVTAGWTAGPHTVPSGNEGLQSPTPNSLHLVACGNKDTNAVAGGIGVSSNTLSATVAVAPQSVDQVIQNSVQSSQLGQHVVAPDSNMLTQLVQSVSNQNQNPQGWSGGLPQNLQPNVSVNMAGLQQLAYSQWTGVPNIVQNPNPAGNFMPAVTPQEQWGQFPFPVNQPNMMQQQQQAPHPSVTWGTMSTNPNMGWVAPNQVGWGPMVQGGPQVTGTIDPTWVMQAGNMQASWVPQPQVPGVVPNQSWVAPPGTVVTGNGNPGWVAPPGTQVASTVNQGAPAAGWVAPPGTQAAPSVNQGAPVAGWTPTVNQGAPVTNMNTGWVGGSANQGSLVANQGWVPPTANQGAQPLPPPPPPGNTNNQNWSSPARRNHGGNWGGNETNRGSFSGQRRNSRGSGYYGGNRRNFNRQESFHNDGGSFRKDDDGGSFHTDDGGSLHKDGGSFHGSGESARSSDQ